MGFKLRNYPPPYSQAPPPAPIFRAPPTAPAPPMVVVSSQVGPGPVTMTCPRCQANIQTRVQYESSMNTHLFALLLFAFGCWCCCCIPYFCPNCKNANHYCPNCGIYIGTYKS